MKDAPLLETVGLMVVLGLMAIPLAAVTRDRELPDAPVVKEEPSEHGMVETLVQVRSAHPFQYVQIRRDEKVLGRIEGPAVEGELTVSLDGTEDWIVIEAELPDDGGLTALGLEFWPEGLPTYEETFWGRGPVVEELQIRWIDE